MADFPEFRESGAHREPSFLRPTDTRTPPGKRHRSSRRNQPGSHTRLPPTPEIPRKPPPPPQPVPIPSPHIKARGIAELNQSLDRYASNTDRGGPDLESGTEQREGSPTPEEHQRSFAGGFMSGLKGLSRYMMRDRSPERNPGFVLSGYESPGRPGSFYVQASMPVAEPEPAAIRQHHSPSRTSKHSHDHNGSLDLHDGETTVVHHETSPLGANLLEPVTADPRPSSDYAKMDSPFIDVPTNISLHSRITSIRNFFRDVNELPWVATHVAADYIPNSRRRTTGRRPVSSWYAHSRRQSIDLLSGESSPTPPTHHRRAFSSITPGVAHNEGYRSPKSSNEPPTGGHTRPKYPHGYVPAPSVRYAAPSISVGSIREHGETPPVVPVYPRGSSSREAHGPGRSGYSHPISRPPTAHDTF